MSKPVKRLAIGLLAIGLTGCGTTYVHRPVESYVPAGVRAPSPYESTMQTVWDQTSASDQLTDCQSWRIAPYAMHEAFVSGLRADLDADQAWAALESILRREC